LASPFLGRDGYFGVKLGAYEVWVWHFDGGCCVLVAFEEVFKAPTRKEDVSDDLFAFWSRVPESGQMMKLAWLSEGGQLLIYQSFRMPVSFSTPSEELYDPHTSIEITLANDVWRSELTRVVWLRAISLSATRDVEFMQQCLGTRYLRPGGKQDALALGRESSETCDASTRGWTDT
jgi:hypothetical protein